MKDKISRERKKEIIEIIKQKLERIVMMEKLAGELVEKFTIVLSTKTSNSNVLTRIEDFKTIRDIEKLDIFLSEFKKEFKKEANKFHIQFYLNLKENKNTFINSSVLHILNIKIEFSGINLYIKQQPLPLFNNDSSFKVKNYGGKIENFTENDFEVSFRKED